MSDSEKPFDSLPGLRFMAKTAANWEMALLASSAANEMESLRTQLVAAVADYAKLKAINDNNTASYLDEMNKHTDTLQQLAAAEKERDEAREAARILLDDLSQFTRVEWLVERWPFLKEAPGDA